MPHVNACQRADFREGTAQHSIQNNLIWGLNQSLYPLLPLSNGLIKKEEFKHTLSSVNCSNTILMIAIAKCPAWKGFTHAVENSYIIKLHTWYHSWNDLWATSLFFISGSCNSPFLIILHILSKFWYFIYLPYIYFILLSFQVVLLCPLVGNSSLIFYCEQNTNSNLLLQWKKICIKFCNSFTSGFTNRLLILCHPLRIM